MAKKKRGTFWEEKNSRRKMGAGDPPSTPFVPDILKGSWPGEVTSDAITDAMKKLADAMKTTADELSTKWPSTFDWAKPMAYRPAPGAYGFTRIDARKTKFKEVVAELQQRWHNVIGKDGIIAQLQLSEDERVHLLSHLASNLGWYIQEDETELDGFFGQGILCH